MNRCPCCGEAIDPTEQPYLRGLVINRRASLSSRILQLEEQYTRSANRAPSLFRVDLAQKILEAKIELANVRELERSLS